MLIREATDADVPRLIDMSQRFLLQSTYGTLLAPTRAQLEVFVGLIRQLGTVLVGERLERVEAMLGLYVVPHPIDGQLVCEEAAWWVEPAYRGGSVGPRLLEAGEAWARRKNAVVLKMAMPTDNPVGGFLTRRGYRAAETVYYKGL